MGVIPPFCQTTTTTPPSLLLISPLPHVPLEGLSFFLVDKRPGAGGGRCERSGSATAFGLRDEAPPSHCTDVVHATAHRSEKC